jgi:hypothetical protein
MTDSDDPGAPERWQYPLTTTSGGDPTPQPWPLGTAVTIENLDLFDSVTDASGRVLRSSAP